jgi:hypothetical protein
MKMKKWKFASGIAKIADFDFAFWSDSNGFAGRL